MTPEKPRHEGEVDYRGYHTTHKALLYADVSDVGTLCADCGLEGVSLRNPCRKPASPAPAALGTPEGEHFSVVSWRRKGDDLWLYHKASGNKKANLYELALVGEIEALRAERIALSPTPNQEKKE